MGEEKKYKQENRIFLVSILIVILVILLIYFLSRDHWALWAYGNVKDRNGLLMKDIISMIGGLVIIAGLYISFMRSRAFQQSVEKQNEQIQNQQTEINLTREANLNEQFKNAVEHLGSNSEPIILGGVAELNGLAENNPDKFEKIVVDIFTSYCRSEARNGVDEKNIKWNVIQLILNYLSTNSVYFRLPVNLDNTNLRRATLAPTITLENWSFNNSIFPTFCSEALFVDCKFKDAKFLEGEYSRLNFENCNIEKIHVEGCKFDLCSFLNGFYPISGYFISSHFRYNHFDTDLRLAHFWDCTFKNDFTITTLDVCSFMFSKFDSGKLIGQSISRGRFIGCLFQDYEFHCESNFLLCAGIGKLSKINSKLSLNIIRAVSADDNDFSGLKFISISENMRERNYGKYDGHSFVNDYNDRLINKSRKIIAPVEWDPKYKS